MKNYTYGWMIKDNGYNEIPIEEYTEHQVDMNNLVKSMSPIIKDAKCGWDGVRYEVVKHKERNNTIEYMVLYVGDSERWIPVSANSKGCNFSVLGENLW